MHHVVGAGIERIEFKTQVGFDDVPHVFEFEVLASLAFGAELRAVLVVSYVGINEVFLGEDDVLLASDYANQTEDKNCTHGEDEQDSHDASQDACLGNLALLVVEGCLVLAN